MWSVERWEGQKERKVVESLDNHLVQAKESGLLRKMIHNEGIQSGG
jgi:hypothetical protein